MAVSYKKLTEVATASSLSAAGSLIVEDSGALKRVPASVLRGFAPTVYCWGDSLTEGVGGWTADGAVISAYPDVVGRSYPCVNLGCRGETVQTIMARQGADPMVVGGFTIPASCDTPVQVGYLKGSYSDADRAGIATVSGDLAQPLKETEAGINPCTIMSVKGRLYRDFTQDAQGRYGYYFKREKDGEAVTVPLGTQIVTYAMTHYKGGICVLWMGANGSLSGHTDFLDKMTRMLEYGAYVDYLVVIAREFSGDSLAAIRAALTDNDGVCHLLYLPPLLVERGYTLAGISNLAGNPDTSNWGTAYSITDTVLLNAPRMMMPADYSPCGYEMLHFSSFGYKAIGKLIVEKLGELPIVGATSGSGGTGGAAQPWYETDVSDEYGNIAYRLTRPKIGTGVSYDTGFKPYDTDKNWTIVCKFSDSISVTDGWLGSVFEMYEQFGDVRTAVAARKQIETVNVESYDIVYSMLGGKEGVNLPMLNGASEYFTPSTDGWRYAIISKNGDQIDYYMDGNHIYGWYFTHPIDGNYSQHTIRLFGRSADGETVVNTITGTIADFRIYTSYLSPTICAAIQAELEG